jgi:soluble P-type ATPase
VPGRTTYRLQHLVLDGTGTVAVDGRLVEGVAWWLAALRRSLEVHMLTADTRRRQQVIDAQLGMKAVRIALQNEAAQKASLVRELGARGYARSATGPTTHRSPPR